MTMGGAHGMSRSAQVLPAPAKDAFDKALVFDAELLARYDVNGPRYTSYPTADRFHAGFGPSDYRGWLERRGSVGSGAAWGPLSIYVHVPFCEQLCYYCGCNKVVTRHHERSQRYLDALAAEMRLVSEALTGSRRVEQLHLGGGTPTFLSTAELAGLIAELRRHFEFSPEGDFGIEIDPRTVSPTRLAELFELGFNRTSFGVQDFDPLVQQAVNRIQSFAATEAVMQAARQARFRSINIDLIYGLPLQSRASFSVTLEQVLSLRPDRIALYNYAHLPERFKPQRRIDSTQIPSPSEKLGILTDAIARLVDAGYVLIGMDHFALPDDELARAQRKARLHRNFQGYSTHPDCDLIGLGVSSIGKVGPTYAQSARDLESYYGAVENGRLPIVRGAVLDADDLVRRAVIVALMCQFALCKESIGSAYLIDFDHYFLEEREELKALCAMGIIEESEGWITVTPKGRLLVRAVAMVFDRYLRTGDAAKRYSRIL
jgi:oxygen-independent coproporphyrinogen-3 oxidase